MSPELLAIVKALEHMSAALFYAGLLVFLLMVFATCGIFSCRDELRRIADVLEDPNIEVELRDVATKPLGANPAETPQSRA